MSAPYQTLGANRYAGPAGELPTASEFPPGGAVLRHGHERALHHRRHDLARALMTDVERRRRAAAAYDLMAAYEWNLEHASAAAYSASESNLAQMAKLVARDDDLAKAGIERVLIEIRHAYDVAEVPVWFRQIKKCWERLVEIGDDVGDAWRDAGRYVERHPDGPLYPPAQMAADCAAAGY